MYHLTNRDLWFTTPPGEAEQAAWEDYADRYHDRAERIVVDFLTDTVPTAVDRTDREILIAALTCLVHGQDTEMVTAWAGELKDEIPSFEQWRSDQRERAA
jgi:hypothetical protein